MMDYSIRWAQIKADKLNAKNKGDNIGGGVNSAKQRVHFKHSNGRYKVIEDTF